MGHPSLPPVRAESPFIHGVPEATFRVRPGQTDSGHPVTVMTTGPWMRAPDGRPSRGSLGVLIDDMLGYAVVERRPAASWAVSTEISVDFCGRLPVDGSDLLGQSEAVDLTASGGLARGLVRDCAGAVVAVASQRLRFVPGTPSALTGGEAAPPAEGEPVSSDSTLMDLLQARSQRTETGAEVAFQARPELSNPMGNLHGGVLLCASEVAGLIGLTDERGPLGTSSIRINFVRPGPVSGEVTFTARVLHRGRTFGVAEVVATNADGKACSVATVTGEALD